MGWEEIPPPHQERLEMDQQYPAIHSEMGDGRLGEDSHGDDEGYY